MFLLDTEKEKTEGHKEEGHVTVGDRGWNYAATSKEHQEPLDTGRGKEDLLLEPSEGTLSC